MIEPELGLEVIGERREPSGHDADLHAKTLECGDERLRPRSQLDTGASVVDHGCVQAGQRPDTFSQRRLEVDLSGHCSRGDLPDPVGGPGALSEKLDHLVLDERRIDVEHHETLGATVDAFGLNRQIDAVLPGDLEQ